MTFRDSWSPEHSNALRSLVSDGFGSYADITKKLNSDFDTNYSRSAVIGRASRMGLPSINPAPSKSKPKVRSNNVVVFTPKPRVNVPPAFEFNELKLQCDEIIPLHDGSIVDMEPNTCRWPYGDGPFLFCGHPITEGSSYCLPHFCRSIGSGTESERSAHKALEAAAG